MTKLYKCLGPNRTPIFGGSGQWHPNAWMPEVEVKLCKSGYHLCKAENIIDWLGPEIWEAKGRGTSLEADDKIAFAEARLVRKLDWDAKKMVSFAADCAEHVLHLFEEQFPNDDRPRKAIEAARSGDTAAGAARAAIRAAWEAAEAVARAAGAAAAAGAAGAAAAAAAEAAAAAGAAGAAGAAARSAAWDAAWAAWSAAWDAAAWDAGDAAAWDAEEQWQIDLLLGPKYLNLLAHEATDGCLK